MSSAKGRTGGGWRGRADVAARALAAAAMGYVIAALAASLIARVLPGPVTEGVMAGMVLSFAIYAAVGIWSFAVPNSVKLWIYLAGVTLVLGGLLKLTYLVDLRP